jgi:hypothetical protein
MSLVVNQSVPVIAAQGVTADVVLQPGSVVNARVLQILGNDQVRIAIGGQSLDVQSLIPLQAGQTLQLAVSQTDSGIRLAVVNQQSGAAGQGVNSAGAAASFDQVTLAPDAAVRIAAQTASAVPPTAQLTPQEALAVSTAAQVAATQQTSLAPLFANLDVAAGLTGLPPQVQQAVAQLLVQRTSLDQNLSGGDVKQAFQNSGLFLEAHLASGLAPSAATPDLKAALIVLRQVLTTSLAGADAAPAASQAPATPSPGIAAQATAVLDEAPVLAVLEQGVQPLIPGTSRAAANVVPFEAPATASPPLSPATGTPAASLQGAALPLLEEVLDFSAARQIISPASTPADAAARAAANTAGLSLLQETLQLNPLNTSGLMFDDGLMLSLLPTVTGTRTSRVDDSGVARTNLPPPPINGALPAAQPVMPATLVSNSKAETAMHHLLADTDGAIARQTLLQVASLPDRVDTSVARLDPAAPRWNFEIPFATTQGTAVAQFEISRDSAGHDFDAAKRVWRARFSLDVEPAGPVHALVSLTGDKTSVRMWAERPATVARLRAGASQLSQALVRAELQPGDIVIGEGAPTQPAPASAGHFLDRAL